ncbi:uncharacterized protein METZ01_LOCUS431996, partial [marine metagenome]
VLFSIIFSKDTNKFNLKSGERISGTISGETDSTYTLDTAFGTITLNKANIQTDEELIYLKSEDHKTENNQYVSVGFLDHKTGNSLVGYARTLKKVDKHELFVGVGTLVAMNTLSAGWKYYLLDSPIHLYSVVSIQGIAGMGGGFISPFLSVGAEKSITDKLYINLGLNTVIRVYKNRPNELVPFPNVNLNWRF